MLESAIQSNIKKKMQDDGWIVVKLIKTSMNGIPDILALKDGKIQFIEVKQKKGVLSEIQKYRINQLKEMGFDVRVWIGYEQDYVWD